MGNQPKQYLEILAGNPHERKALNQLINTSFSIAKTYLRVKYFSATDPKLGWSDNIDDIAMDAIVPLFVINGSNKLGILKALENWKSGIKDDSDALFFLTRVVWKRVEQTVVKLIKTRDPIFGKIHKNLSTCISNNPFQKINYLGKTFIVREGVKEITGLIIPEKEFEKLPTYLFEKKQHKLCNGLLDYLEKETQYFPAIPMNELVKKIKTLYFASKIPENPDAAIDAVPAYIDDIFQISINKIKDKLYNHYLKKGKLTEDECDTILKTFYTISQEMKNGGLNHSLYEYLLLHKPALTKNDFYDNYHGILNYLLGELKKNIYLLINEQ